MVYILMVVVYRSCSTPREEELVVDILYEVEDAPPSYPEEKVSLVENA